MLLAGDPRDWFYIMCFDYTDSFCFYADHYHKHEIIGMSFLWGIRGEYGNINILQILLTTDSLKAALIYSR